ncbi:hypothetical protein SAMN05421734_102442 [Pelagirhabdus alkalitolerans]|uniref:LysM domain-containing protein n=1 Tax=Pelagirhabdus alkalitolerans TaxID=1612202 RepID=A0A1G6HBP4_9BACI|nr:hypothetical protein [Pelagirhabdus alkalitolerans]SDB91508.1 hypothetical protein SAMN05421734_102442 [Pelagirhabdus alkalitolerans]
MYQPQDDQAHTLREQMESIQSHSETQSNTEDEHRNDVDDSMDLLNLPPRSEVHDEKEQKVRWKFSYALIRFVVVIFFIIVAILLSYHYWGDLFYNSDTMNELRADQTIDRVQVVSNQNGLSEEVERTFSLSSEDRTRTIKGHYYFTQNDETLEQVVDAFYQTHNSLPLIKEINDITHSIDQPFENRTRLFLPNTIELN